MCHLGAVCVHLDDRSTMNANVRSAVLAGLISAVIWMIISTLADMSKAAVVVGGLAFLVGTALITMAISTTIAKRATAAR
jgi:hypothetical protein